jgi:hypothetical protein
LHQSRLKKNANSFLAHSLICTLIAVLIITTVPAVKGGKLFITREQHGASLADDIKSERERKQKGGKKCGEEENSSRLLFWGIGVYLL